MIRTTKLRALDCEKLKETTAVKRVLKLCPSALAVSVQKRAGGKSMADCQPSFNVYGFVATSNEAAVEHSEPQCTEIGAGKIINAVDECRRMMAAAWTTGSWCG